MISTDALQVGFLSPPLFEYPLKNDRFVFRFFVVVFITKRSFKKKFNDPFLSIDGEKADLSSLPRFNPLPLLTLFNIELLQD